MTYYKTKRRVFEIINARLKKAEGHGVEKLMLIYELTTEYEIGELTIKKRLDTMIDLGFIKDVGGVLFWQNKRKRR